MKNILSNFDFIGYHPMIHFKLENKFNTSIGGFLTVLISILTILATVSFGDDLFRRINPFVLLNKEFIQPELNITQNMIIGYRLFYTGGIKIDDLDKLVDIFILHSVLDPKLSKANLTRFEMIKCNESDVYKSNYLNITNLVGKPEDYYCYPNNMDIYLKGKYGSPINNHMHLRINMCKNTTENKNSCYPSDVIKKKLSSFFVTFLYRDSYIDGRDYYNPVKYYITSNTLKSSSYNFRQDAYLFKEVIFKTDSGLILEDNYMTSHFQLDNILSSTTAEPDTQTFTNVIIGLNNIRDYYNRRYLKIQDVTAQVGGIIKFFLVIVEFFITFYAYFPFLENLYDSLYDIKLLNKYKEEYKNINSNCSDMNLNIPKVIPIKCRNTIVDGRNINNFNEIKKRSYYYIFFRFLIRKKNSKYFYYEKISNHYKKNFDIENLLLNNQKLASLNDFIFNMSEQEIIKLYSIYDFFNKEKEITTQLIDIHLADAKVFEKLKIPKNLFILSNQIDDNKINDNKLDMPMTLKK